MQRLRSAWKRISLVVNDHSAGEPDRSGEMLDGVLQYDGDLSTAPGGRHTHGDSHGLEQLGRSG